MPIYFTPVNLMVVMLWTEVDMCKVHGPIWVRKNRKKADCKGRASVYLLLPMDLHGLLVRSTDWKALVKRSS